MDLREALAPEALRDRVLLGDGANGTLLESRGYHRQPYDLAVIDAPELVGEVHREYIAAGADFIETNTYQASRFRLPDGYDEYPLNLRGAQIARAAASDAVFVLGAIGPAGKPIEPIGTISVGELTESVTNRATALAAGGVDGFILETYADLDEMEAAVRAIRSVSDLPILALKAFIEDGEMLAEGLPLRSAQRIADMGVDAVGANCIVGPQRMLDLVRQMAEGATVPIAAFPTPGMPQLVKGVITYDSSPEYFAGAIVRLAEEGARIVGGCCGTSPDHIREIRRLLDKGPIRVKPRTSVAGSVKSRAPLPETPLSEFGQRLGREFVVSVEMDVPRGLKIDKLVAGAAMLRDAGVHIINISDGARARLRMNPAAVSQIIQTRADIEVCMHFSCRDRNLLAVQSDLLGAHALGIRNILAVTGDPANIGDYPSATSVFDVDSIGLCRILRRFNEGIDLAGYSIGVRCGFSIAVAFNPLAQDSALEMDRLKRKVDAGAQVIFTQPVFDRSALETCLNAAAAVGIPTMVGVLPLKSARHAEFMHHEVPGISVPDNLRARIAEATDEESALAVGIAAAQELCRSVKTSAAGLYLMPPFGSAEVARDVISAIR